MGGIEERWRDDTTWLLSGIAEILDLRCFYFHLLETCDADPDRIKRVKEMLLRMRTQAFQLREHLSYCSPLGPVLLAIRKTSCTADGSPTVGVRSIRRLEEAGIRTLEDLASMETHDLVRLGVRQDLAGQIYAYVSGTG